MDEIGNLKKKCRTRALAQRKIFKTKSNDCLIQKNLSSALRENNNLITSGYLPIGSEADPVNFMNKLALDEVVAVPVIVGKDKPLKFTIWTPDSELELGAFGVLIPKSVSWVVPDILLVPLIAFDSQGGRLGYGGGFYDRTLSMLRSQKNIKAIGIAFSGQCVEKVPVELTDQPLDGIVTELGTLWF